MRLILPILLILAIVFGPSLWVRHVMNKYSRPADRYPGTGGELARHLLKRFGLEHVQVEPTDQGDHYDPEAKAVRLTQDKYDGRSLTAITVAAHEVGHALQDRDGYAPLRLRTRLVRSMHGLERVGAFIMVAAPFAGIIARAPGVGILMFLGGMLSLGSAALVHLVTLPTEFDASFGRALPTLEKGEYLRTEDHRHARRLLKAAALTYVSASLMSLLNVARWIALLRR